MGNAGRDARSAHSFNASNRTFLLRSCQFACAKAQNQTKFDSQFFAFRQRRNLQIFKKESVNLLRLWRSAQKAKRIFAFARYSLEI